MPNLSAAPMGAIDALESQCKKELKAGKWETCAWVVDLEKHYEKLDTVK